MPLFVWGIILKPFIALFILVGICLPGRLLVERKMKDGKLKRLLLRRIS